MYNDDCDFCRVCRCEGTSSKPLFYPCMCTGSIKYIHQECLVQWLQYSKRQTCELCTHRFTFKPVYADDTPAVVPLHVLLAGLLSTARDFGLRALHTLAVLISWLFVVPLTVSRIYKCLFSGGHLSGLLSLPLDMLSTEHVIQDCIQGFLIVIVALAAFLGYIWLREQLSIGGEPAWLAAPTAPAQPANQPAAERPPPEDGVAAPAAANHEPEAEVDRQAIAPAQFDAGDHGAGGGGGGGGEDFDAAIGPMNWERIFGLDGTMSFVEHALWLIALSIVFIIIFAAIPFFIGRWMLQILGFQTAILTAPIEGILTTFIGYVAMAMFLISIHTGLKAINMSRTSYFAGLFYIYLKLAIIAFIEVGIFTVFCGIWIDVCSLGMFNASVSQRIRNFNYAPLVFTFIHWTTGLLYLFYISSIFLLLRDVLRPGFLWFMQDLTDPDYKYLQEMVSVPVSNYLQRIVVHFSLAGLVIILTLWVPSRIIQKLLPGFLPFHLSLVYDSPVDYSVEIILLQILMPIALDGQVKIFLYTTLRWWCLVAAWLLGLRSYLLGDVAFQPGDVIVLADGRCVPAMTPPSPQPDSNGEEINHESAEPEERPEVEDEVGMEGEDEGVGRERRGGGYKSYIRPRFFELRLVGLMIFLVASLSGISLAAFVLPVAYGRAIMTGTSLATPQAPPHDAITLFIGLSNIVFFVKLILYLPTLTHNVSEFVSAAVDKLYTMLTWTRWRSEQFVALYRRLFRGDSPDPSAYNNGLHVALVAISGGFHGGPGSRGMEGLGFREIVTFLWAVVHSLSFPIRLGLLLILLVGILPLCLGLLTNLIIFIPLRIPPEKTLVLGFPENWIFGVMLLTVGLLGVLLGPRWRLRDGLEELHDELHLNWPVLRTTRILLRIAPFLVAVALALVFPFLFAHYTAPLIGLHPNTAFRYVYPIFFALAILIGFTYLLTRQCIALYERIKDDKYLVGRRLVNYGANEPPSADNVVVFSG